MRKLVLLFSSLFFVVSARAGSNLAGAWIDGGDTLSIQIVDDPANAPFTAGEIWTAMKATGSLKAIQTPNFELKCSGTTDTRGFTFGSCKMKVAKSLVIVHPSETNFAVVINNSLISY